MPRAETPPVPPLKWHGGKQYLAKRIIALMPPHTHYVEPYAGGLAVLLDKSPEDCSEVVNDLNGRLVNFWLALRDVAKFERFHRLAAATPFAEPFWQEAAATLDEGDEVQQAYAFFVHCRQSLAGRMQDFAPLSKRRTRRGMNEQASAWWSVVDGLPEVHARLRRVVVMSRDALEVIRSQDNPQTLFYLDPPYLHETRATTTEYGPHEMSAEQHEALLGALVGIEGKFLLSGYDNPLYKRFMAEHGWDRVAFDLPNHAGGGPAKRRMEEVVWANFKLAPGASAPRR